MRVVERMAATGPRDPSAPEEVREPALECETESDLTALVRAAREVAAASGHREVPPPWLPPLPHYVPLSDLGAPPAGGHAPAPSTLIPLGLGDRPTQQRQDEEAWNLATDGHLGIAGGARSGRTSAVLTLALGIAQQCSPEQAHLHLLEGCPGALAVLGGLPHVGSVTSAADPAHARRAVDRLTRQLDGTEVPLPRFTVVLVDGWEALQEAFDRLDHGGTTERLLRLLRDGLTAGIRFVITGGRALTGGRLVPLVQRRLVLALPDPLDLALVGLDRSAAPNPWPPGRAVDPATALQLQIGYVPRSPHGEPAGDRGLQGAETSARSSVSTPPAAISEERTLGGSATSVVAASRARWSQVPPASLPWTLTPLPRRVLLRDLPSGPPPQLTIGLGGEEPTALGFDPASGQRRVLVAGTRRSGRSTALHALAARLVEQHLPVIVVAPRSSGPRPDGRDLGHVAVHRLGAGDAARFVELRRATPHVAILVDDADILDGSPMAGALAEAATLVQAAGGVMAVAVEVGRRPVAFRGVVAEIARDATGLLLCPTSPADGDLFGLRAEPVATRAPGRGWLIVDGEATPIQVADPA